MGCGIARDSEDQVVHMQHLHQPPDDQMNIGIRQPVDIYQCTFTRLSPLITIYSVVKIILGRIIVPAAKSSACFTLVALSQGLPGLSVREDIIAEPRCKSTKHAPILSWF